MMNLENIAKIALIFIVVLLVIYIIYVIGKSIFTIPNVLEEHSPTSNQVQYVEGEMDYLN